MTKHCVIFIIVFATLAAKCNKPIGFPEGEDCTILSNSIICTDTRRTEPPERCILVNGPKLTYECPLIDSVGYQCTSPKDYEIRLKWMLNNCKVKASKDATSGDVAMDGLNLPDKD